MKDSILVAARNSPLSVAQVQEVLAEIRQHSPTVTFEHIPVATTGDIDQHTSLRTMDKTDFFTKEIDQMQLNGQCRISIHSAKDLPEPLPKGLCLAALTRGVDNADSLVMHDNFPSTAPLIATSSERREEAVKELYPTSRFVDIRGTIQGRLAKMERGEVDGVVIAEAALIRLGLIHLKRIKLPGKTVENQGRLAVVVREEDQEMKRLFHHIDDRRRQTLYVGHYFPNDPQGIHFPLIKTIPLPFPKSIPEPTHLIFTSGQAVDLYFKERSPSRDVKILSVGQATTSRIEQNGYPVWKTAENESAEGLVELLKAQDPSKGFYLWPHSAKSRPIVSDYLRERGFSFLEFALYDTQTLELSTSPVNLNFFTEVFFSSPSTVDAFLSVYGGIPPHIKPVSIGNVTGEYLNRLGHRPRWLT